jgi:sigma-E factor negative regulatory protein RseB
LRAESWPCPAALQDGYALLDVRQRAAPSGGRTLHLTYGDGLSAISVFLQRGELDAARLAGLAKQKWGEHDIYVSAGWPEVMVWQGGPTVITVVTDAEPSQLRTILGTLPRQSNHGTLGSLQQRMGSAFARFRG